MALAQRLAEFEGEIEAFVSGQIAQADGAKKEYDVVVQTASVVRGHLEEEFGAMSTLEAVQNDAELVKERVLRLKGEETALKRAHASHSAEVASAGADVEKGLHQLRTALEMYKRLGLTFDSATMDGVEVLKIIFTHIDPRDVTAQFAFAVHVSATDTYKVALCEPPVKTDDLVAALNATSNFSKFTQAMRRRFKETL